MNKNKNFVSFNFINPSEISQCCETCSVISNFRNFFFFFFLNDTLTGTTSEIERKQSVDSAEYDCKLPKSVLQGKLSALAIQIGYMGLFL